MYWSHADTATYETWLSQRGFTVCWTRFVPEGQGGHTLLLAQAGGGAIVCSPADVYARHGML